MSIHSTRLVADERLVVRPKVAAQMLDVGITRLYELIAEGQLESFKDGKARKITTRSIHAFVDRGVAKHIHT